MNGFKKKIRDWYEALDYQKQLYVAVAGSAIAFTLVWFGAGDESLTNIRIEKAKIVQLQKEEQSLNSTASKSPNELLIAKRNQLQNDQKNLNDSMPKIKGFDFSIVAAALPKGGRMSVLPARNISENVKQRLLKVSFESDWAVTQKTIVAISKIDGAKIESVSMARVENGSISTEIIMASYGKEDSWQKLQ